MSILLNKVAVFLSIIYIAFAAVAISLPSENSDYPGKCFDLSTKTAYTIGSHYPEGQCMEISCNKDYSFSYYTCGAVGEAPTGFHYIKDLTLKYPDCCVKLIKN